MVDLTADEKDMDAAPTTPSPNLSEDGSSDSAEMDTDEEDAILYVHRTRTSKGPLKRRLRARVKRQQQRSQGSVNSNKFSVGQALWTGA